MNFDTAPKIELHLHLDCSLTFELVKQMDPSVSSEAYERSFIAPPKCLDLADYISRAVKGIALMQTREQLRLVVLDLFKQLKSDGVIYAEIRYAPLLHTEKELTPEEVVETVNEAVMEGMKKYDLEMGVILSTLRNHSEEQSMETVRLIDKFKSNSCVVGFDLAADEAGFPIDNHISAFQFAKRNGIRCTAHAGEAKGPESVWESIKNFHLRRIGHGVRSIEDPELLAYLKTNEIHLEICPTSNIQTNVFDKIEDHPVNKIFELGISTSINTDARTISNVSLTDEYRLLKNVFGWDKAHFKKCNLEAVKHSFASKLVKSKLKRIIEQSYT